MDHSSPTALAAGPATPVSNFPFISPMLSQSGLDPWVRRPSSVLLMMTVQEMSCVLSHGSLLSSSQGYFHIRIMGEPVGMATV